MITLAPAQEISRIATVQVLKRYSYVLLAGETRTGKTAISVLSMKEVMGEGHILFITKKESVSNISAQMKELPEPCNGIPVNDPKIKQVLGGEIVEGRTNVIVVNYESVSRFIRKCPEIYAKVRGVIVDECHNAIGSYRNPSKPNGRIRYLLPVCENALLIMMSATPSPESWSGLFYLFRLAGDRSPWSEYHINSKYGFYQWCRDGYVNVEMKQKNWRLGDHPKNLYPDYSKSDMERINKDISRYRITLSQEEVGFKTKVVERILRVKMMQKTVMAFDYMHKHGCLLYSADEDSYILTDTPVAKKSKMHQIVGGGIIAQDKTLVVWDSSKIVAIINDMKKQGYQKSAIYYKYIFEKEIIETELKKKGYTVHSNDMQFNADTQGVYIKQIISGREGVNLSTSSVLYMYNTDFAFLSYAQTKDRIINLNKTEKCELVWVFSQTGFEEDIYNVVVKEKTDYTAKHYRKNRFFKGI